jgi:short subunit dehydrogenase-like uncharacterized protein
VNDSRQYDVVIWGATGFTGRLVAEYLMRAAPAGLKWALGGRNERKLEEVRTSLGANVPLVIADANDEKSLDTLVSSTRAIATTVGPYRSYGAPLVAAAARAGTHYCDLTGEPHFVREMIDLHHSEAKRTGAKIVHCCGFDSIPSDLGVLMMQEHARKKFGRALSSVKFLLRSMSGGISGGTIASALLLAEEMGKDPSLRKRVGNPYVLDPDYEGRGPDKNDQFSVKWDEDAQAWTGPFVMAAINTRVVRRSNALQGYAYGKDFRYSEVMGFKKGLKGALTASGITAGLGAFFLTAASSPGRSLLKKMLPATGEGPSKEAREKGHFHVQLIGHGNDEQGHPVRTIGHVRGASDPGYGETAKMLGETVLALADRDAPQGGGVMTPASTPGLGVTLISRLRNAGMTFEVEG